MKKETEKYLIEVAKTKISNDDPSHDINHAIRVLNLAKFIAKKEGGDLDVVVPSAIFHDVICYQKNDPRSKFSAEESALFASNILEKVEDFPKEKINKVYKAICECSFSKGIVSDFLEGKILQDADKLEATGIISIMRTFSSTGQMKKQFYCAEDPFCKNRKPSKEYGLDLFFDRLLIVKDMMYTKTARKIAKRRTKVLQRFLKDFEIELFKDIR